MNSSFSENFNVQVSDAADISHIIETCRMLNLPVEYFPVFAGIHLCSPDHFCNSCYSRDDLRKMFNAIDLSSTANAIISIALWEESPVKAALLLMCSKEVLSKLEAALHQDAINVNIVTQLQNMRLLYFKAEFREHLTALYKFFIKPKL